MDVPAPVVRAAPAGLGSLTADAVYVSKVSEDMDQDQDCCGRKNTSP